MLNSIEAYEEQGRLAAKARNQKDEGTAQGTARHFRRMRDLEKDEDRAAASAAYKSGYEAVRNVPGVTYHC